VNHEPDVGFVDTHAKGYRRANHVDVFIQKSVLIVHSGLRVQTGVVGECLYVVDAEQFGYFLHGFPAQTIYDSRLTLVLLDEFDELLFGLDLRLYFVVKIFTVERRFVEVSFLHLQVLLNVDLHLCAPTPRCSALRR